MIKFLIQKKSILENSYTYNVLNTLADRATSLSTKCNTFLNTNSN